MFSEGVGLHSPKAVTVLIRDKNALIAIGKMAEMLSSTKGYNLENALRGLIGEAAVAQYLYEEAAVLQGMTIGQVLPKGDGGIDLSAYGITLQIKTVRPGGDLLVKRFASWSGLLGLNANAYVFCELGSTIPNLAGWQSVDLLGFVWKDQLIAKAHYRKSQRFDWMNLEIERDELLPINRLAVYLDAQRRMTNGAYSIPWQQGKVG